MSFNFLLNVYPNRRQKPLSILIEESSLLDAFVDIGSSF